MPRFKGYRRKDGTVGIRNQVVVFNTVAEVGGLVKRMAQEVDGVVPVVHQDGYAQFPEDREQTFRTLVGNAINPNNSAVLFIGLGGEDDTTFDMVNAVLDRGRKAFGLVLEECKSIDDLMEQGTKWLKERMAEAAEEPLDDADTSELIVGLECGGSDAWSGVTANPAIGEASDLIVAAGGTVILAETTEAIGAEHILAAQAITPEVGQKFLDIVEAYERRMKASGSDYRMGNPSPGNKRGGLTTLEEKSLGCIKKGGTTPLMEVVRYADRPTKKGFVFMDTPGYDVDSVTGLTAGGAQVVLFSTGRGSPTGSPISPVIKVGTNTPLYRRMSQHIDVNAGVILDGEGSLESVGREIFDKVHAVAQGELSAAERHGHREFSIWRLAETI